MSEHRLNEIVIERPRGGAHLSLKKKGYKKRLRRLTIEAQEDGLLTPYQIKPLRKTKYFSDHIAPLRRLLYSKVGLPWDQVYKELSQRLDIKTLSGQHILSHVWRFVEKHVQIVDNIVFAKPSQNSYSFYQLYVGKLYIHPDTGILCIYRKIDPDPVLEFTEITCLEIDTYHQYQKLEGIWYLIAFEPTHPDTSSETIIYRNGEPMCITNKKQCNKKELKLVTCLLLQSKS